MPDIIDLSSRLITGMGAEQPLYEVPNSGMIVLQDVINATWNKGLDSKNEFSAKIAAASDDVTGFLGTAATPTITAGTVTGAAIVEPVVNIPEAVDASAVFSMFDTKYLELVALLEDKFDGFRTTFFPDESAAYSAAEDWLQAAIANPEAGLPAAVVAQIFGDDQARILGDASRASDAVLEAFAARRFPLPPGAAAGAVLQIEQKAQDEISESSRKVAILSVELQKFNVEKLLANRQSAMSAAIEYVKTLASGPEMASRLINTGYDAQSKLISAASSFYNARIAAAEVANKVAQYNNSTALEADSKNQAAELSMIGDKLKALLTEAQAIAQMATSLFNNLHVSTSLSANGGTAISTSGSF